MDIASLIVSFLGLLVSVYSVYKIDNVKKLMELRTSKKIIITHIETIVQYDRRKPLTVEQKRFIRTTIKHIGALKIKHETINTSIKAIEKELNSKTQSVKNIVSSFTDISQFIKEEI